jgi:oligopeptide/dipeptide ABC transporter ATP-binding protein
MDDPVLIVENLSVAFGTGGGSLRAAQAVSFTLRAGETLCLVGESGSGKSVSALALLGLLPKNARITADTLTLKGRSLQNRTEREMAEIRGSEISMIFQNPMSSLNPAHTIGYQLCEVLRLHQTISRQAARVAALDMLDKVRISDAARRLDEYPHQLSGGMRQRVMIAMALACKPKVLVADEPTTALDVTVQAQILRLIEELKADFGAAVLFITHDLGVVAELADKVAVMYAGRIVEQGPVEAIFDAPSHGYTLGLLKSLVHGSRKVDRLPEIPGSTPQIWNLDKGCTFAPRCAFAEAACRIDEMENRQLEVGHSSRCRRHALVRQVARSREELDHV